MSEALYIGSLVLLVYASLEFNKAAAEDKERFTHYVNGGIAVLLSGLSAYLGVTLSGS